MSGFKHPIRFCNSSDNAKIAYIEMGEGLPILKTGNWLSDLSTDLESFIWRHFFGEFSRTNKLFSFDQRGFGLSVREIEDFSIEAQTADIEAIVSELNLESFCLFGFSNGAASAINFAARHPEKVCRLILHGGAVGFGSNEYFNQFEDQKIRHFLQTVKTKWEDENFQNECELKIYPDLSHESSKILAELRKNSCSAEAAFLTLKTFFETDITETAKKIKCPTLIFHSMDDELVPFSQAGLLSALIPDSKMILLDSKNHFLLEDELAWREFVSETKTFLNEIETQNDEDFARPEIDLQATIPMEDARWEKVGALFSEAMKLPSEERRDVLNRIDEDALDLRREVEALIENAENKVSNAAGFLSTNFPHYEVEIYASRVIQNYEILDKLGSGGMGIVFRAMDLELEREIALKFLPRRYNSNPAMKQRFKREARAAAALDHLNIGGVFEVGETDDGRLYFAMPFYKGKTLKTKIAEKSITIKTAVEYAAQIADGLAHAHQKGIVHRDIKPENIMITDDGGLKILDFGVAKIADSDVTQKGILLGTISYMSPEQAAGETVDPRTDLWSLGLVLYEMLTGRQPFKNDEISTMISTILLREPTPVAQIAENIPPELEEIVVKSLKKNKSERYQTAQKFLEDLLKIKNFLSDENGLPKINFSHEKFTPLAVKKETPNNLPAQLTPLVGRGRETLEIKDLLFRENVRLVTLSGIGGTGKTRLSHKIARQFLAEFPDGVYFVDLSAIFKTDLVAPEIAQILKIKESGSEQIETILKNFLADKKILLVLDNFEQIVEAAPFVAELLAAAENLKILVTSRNILQIRGEHEYKVPPLDLPDSQSFHNDQSLAQYASITLFIQRAKAAKSDFELSGENILTVVEICKKLEGLPLAIELAAARIKILSPKDLLARLDDQLKVLTSGAKDLPVRQQTMRNAIAWSYDLLDETEQKLFRQFSVFVGGATLEAIENICGENDVDIFETVLLLTDKSLLRRKESADGSFRFQMLEVVRQFSESKLLENGEENFIRQNHAEYFLRVAEEFEPKIRGAEQAGWLDLLEEEHGNLRAAFDYFFDFDVENCLKLSGAIHRLWSVHGHYTEGRNRVESVLDKSPNASKSARTKALIPAADLAWAQGDFEDSVKFYLESLKLSREIGDRRMIAQSCNGLAITKLNQNEFDIRPLLEESLQIGRELADKPIVGVALLGLGELSRLEGNNAEARVYYEEIVDETRADGETFNLLYALFNLGSVSCMAGDAEKAEIQFIESIKIAKTLGSIRAVADCLDGFGYAATVSGNFEKSAKLFGAAEALRESVGFEIQNVDKIFRDHFIEITKNSIGENLFVEYRNQGRKISMEEALDIVL